MKVWFDLTNSPHVLVLRPIIELLKAEGAEVEITARRFAQTVQLCERFGLDHTVLGEHRGGGLVAKAKGLGARTLALTRFAKGKKFDFAIGHGSNDISVAACLLHVRSATMFDYEWATLQHSINCRLASRVVVPEMIPPERLSRYGAKRKLRQFTGLKEEYYLADSEPSETVLDELGLVREKPIFVLRTPPTVSLYHRFENPLFDELIEHLNGTQTVVLPRTEEQRNFLAKETDLILPEHAIDAQSLISFADLVVSAGGTMNREAVALGTPVYTLFEGKLGAVDEQLINTGRLRKLTSVGDLPLQKKPLQETARIRRDPRALLDLLVGY